MGVYLQPTNGQSKVEWLQTHRAILSSNGGNIILEMYETFYKRDLVPVCVHHHGDFSSAAVAFTREALWEILAPDISGRRGAWYLVPLRALYEGSGISHQLLKIRHLL